MNVIKKLTLSNLKLNKKRTIVTIIGVILSTALICAVAGMATSTKKTMSNLYKAYSGDYYVCFKDIQNDQIKYITNNTNVIKSSVTQSLGYSKLNGSYNEDKPYVYVMEFDKNALINTGLKLSSGRFPENNTEIVISESIITNARVNINVGDKIAFDLGNRVSSQSGEVLNQEDSYINIDGLNDSEEIASTNQKTYTVVGIIDRVSYNLESYSAPGYTCISYLDNSNADNISDVYVTYNKAKGYKDVTNNILKTLKENTGKDYDVTYNEELIEIEGGISGTVMKALIIVASVVIAIILISSVFVIRNSFIISVSEKTKQYGILSSVGATSKQVKRGVLYEGFIIGIIGITLGIILGVIAIVTLLWLMNYLLKGSLNGMEFVYDVPFIAFVISIIVSAITIYLSCIIPAHKASKISPIEAIRGNDDIKIKAKKLKTSKLTKKIFGIGGVIARKNLKRSKKKYRTTVVSLVVSVAIFISLSSFLEYGQKSVSLYYTDLSYNIVVNGSSEDLYKEITNSNNLKDYSYSKELTAQIDINKYGTEYGKKIDLEHLDSYKNYNGSSDGYASSVCVVVLNKEYFKNFAREIGITSADYQNDVILEDNAIETDNNGKKTAKNIYNIEEKGNIEITINNKNTDITITKKSDKRPMGYEQTYINGGMLIVSEENKNVDITDATLSALYINSDNPDKLENDLTDLVKSDNKYSNIVVANISKYAKQEKSLILLVSIFLYGFIAVITLIGVTNIFNTITTNMILRSKEFATLKSIGMTSKEFNRMIRLESIMYGFKSLLIGIPIGILGSYGIYKGVMQSMDFGYLLPWKAILISIIFVFIIVGLTMKYSLNKINKQNIIETIREENI